MEPDQDQADIPIAQQVQIALSAICDGFLPDQAIENAREMRFALRLILWEWRVLINKRCTEKKGYQEGACFAVDPHQEGIEDVRVLTAVAISDVLEKARWAVLPSWMQAITPLEHQWANMTMKELQQGMKTVMEGLDAQLEADGSKDKEFSDAELSDEEVSGDAGPRKHPTMSTPGRKQPRVSLTVRPRPQSASDYSEAQAVYGDGKFLGWSREEDEELVKVVRSDQFRLETWQAKAKEFNRRITARRTRDGLPQRKDRTENAVTMRYALVRDDPVLSRISSYAADSAEQKAFAAASSEAPVGRLNNNAFAAHFAEWSKEEDEEIIKVVKSNDFRSKNWRQKTREFNRRMTERDGLTGSQRQKRTESGVRGRYTNIREAAGLSSSWIRDGKEPLMSKTPTLKKNEKPAFPGLKSGEEVQDDAGQREARLSGAEVQARWRPMS